MASGNGQPRTYSIATETASGSVLTTLLTQEIEDDATITTDLDYINTAGDVLDIYFASTLSGPEVTALDAVVAAHDAESTSLQYRFKEENAAQTTTLETYQNAATLTPAKGLKNGVYRMAWTCEHRITASGALNGRIQTRFRIDSNTKSNTASVSEQWECHSGWDRYFADEGEKPVLTLDYRRDPAVGGDDTVEIRKVRLSMEYLGSNDDD